MSLAHDTCRECSEVRADDGTCGCDGPPIPDLREESTLTFQFTSDGRTYSIVVVDERPDMDLDPTLNLYRGDEEDPLATVHLNPDAPCYDHHIVARKEATA